MNPSDSHAAKLRRWYCSWNFRPKASVGRDCDSKVIQLLRILGFYPQFKPGPQQNHQTSKVRLLCNALRVGAGVCRIRIPVGLSSSDGFSATCTLDYQDSLGIYLFPFVDKKSLSEPFCSWSESIGCIVVVRHVE